MTDLFERDRPEPTSEHPLRPYQAQAVHDIRASFASKNRRVLFQLATGGGKTRVLAEVVRLAREKRSKVVLLAPRRELVYQIRKALLREGVKAGVIMAGENPDIYADVHVCSFDTLHARAIQRDKIRMPDADLVIVDEAHLAVADGRQEILSHYSTQKQLLVTATPARGDGRGLCEIADDLVFGPSMKELIELGHLVQPRYFAPSEPDLSKVKKGKDGDYQEKALGNVMDDPKLIGDILDNWTRLASDRRTVVFCVNRKHSRHIAAEFVARGIRAEHLDGETPLDERAAILQRVENGQTQVLCNVYVASYGLDIPALDCAVLARPTKNITLYLQTVGRVLRAFPGKTDALIIDHAGAVEENGYAEDDHPWSLDGNEKIKDRIESQKKEGKEPKEIRCPACGNVFRSSHICPACGYQCVPETEALPVWEADLVEMKRKETAAEKRNRTTSKEDKRHFYGELLHFANSKGKSEGWVAHTYKAAFGVWPNAHKGTDPVAPTKKTLDYIRARQIAFAKGSRA